MKIYNNEKPYHLTLEGVKRAEERYGATYIGCWATKTRNGWSEEPVDVFYQPNPRKDLGHSQYFGLLLKADGTLYICDAKSAFSKPIEGIRCDDDVVIVSKYRHDYVCYGGYFIDGGRDYTRSGGNKMPADNQYVTITVKDGNFVFTSRA